MKYNAILNLGVLGEKVGLVLIALVSVWDIMWAGGRNLLHYSICWKGVLVIWLGLILIMTSKHIDRQLSGR